MATKINPCDVIIFDGSNFAHRLSNALTPLTNRKGERVEVIFGMLRALSAVLKLNPAKKCYMVWDGWGSKLRRQVKDPLYKANRGNMKDEDKERIALMYKQVEVFVRDYLPCFPNTYMVSDYWEADDIMAMLAFHHTEKGDLTTIVTGDKDLLQLVDGNVRVWSPNKELLICDENFEATTGYPDGLAFLFGKCLQGDSSDNVPGIKGIGEKSALKLLEAHNWSLPSLLQEKTFKLGVVRDGLRDAILSPSGILRIGLNYKLMSLVTGKHSRGLHFKNLLRIETQTTTLAKWDVLRKHLAVNQMASILTDFNRWSAPLRSLK